MILTVLALAASPSFDCAKASTKVEKMICGDEQLARLDVAMAAGYPKLQKREREQQRAWLKARDKCETRACLLQTYEGQIVDLFLDRSPGVRRYHSNPNDGDLTILALGDNWYVFSVVGLWPTPGGSANIAEAIGSFRLDANGAASRPATDDGDCGWRVQRLSRDRWQISTLAGEDGPFACYGVNATIDGVYSSGDRKPK